MFAFFLNGSFFSFWQNEPGQIFFDLTVKGMKWDASTVSLKYYSGLISAPEFFRFEENGDLVIQEKQIVEGEIHEEIMVDIQTIASEVYVLNGDKAVSC